MLALTIYYCYNNWAAADVAESADAPDLESGEQSWGFKSLHPHQIKIK